MRRSLLAVCLVAAGCSPAPEWYKIPPQYVAPALTVDSREYVSVTEMGADAYFVKDVQGLEGGFRWTNVEPEFRFYVKSVAQRRLRIHFAINELTFSQTGPVTVAVKVNGNELLRTRYVKAGEYKIDEVVPDAWLNADRENRIVMQILNPWTGEDGTRLGVLLFGIGFVGQ